MAESTKKIQAAKRVIRGVTKGAGNATERPGVAGVGQPVERDLGGYKSIDAPVFHGSSLQIAVTGNDVLLTFSQARPMVGPDGKPAPFGVLAGVATIIMSPQTAKDCAILLTDTVQKMEAESGQIETPFTQRRAKKRAQ